MQMKRIECSHQKTIKMGEFCRSFQMPNEYFSWFHGGSLIPKEIIKQTLNRIGYKNRIFNLAKETGFCRLSNMNTVLFVDIGLNKKMIENKKIIIKNANEEGLNLKKKLLNEEKNYNLTYEKNLHNYSFSFSKKLSFLNP